VKVYFNSLLALKALKPNYSVQIVDWSDAEEEEEPVKEVPQEPISRVAESTKLIDDAINGVDPEDVALEAELAGAVSAMDVGMEKQGRGRPRARGTSRLSRLRSNSSWRKKIFTVKISGGVRSQIGWTDEMEERFYTNHTQETFEHLYKRVEQNEKEVYFTTRLLRLIRTCQYPEKVYDVDFTNLTLETQLEEDSSGDEEEVGKEVAKVWADCVIDHEVDEEQAARMDRRDDPCLDEIRRTEEHRWREEAEEEHDVFVAASEEDEESQSDDEGIALELMA
jgi:hypothetical protein